VGDRPVAVMRRQLPHEVALHGANGRPVAPFAGQLTAAAQLMLGSDIQRPYISESWQEEAWDFYEGLGEFNYGVEWFGEAMSRVRLTAAVVGPAGDEPEILDSGPAVDLVAGLVGGTDGQARMLQSFGIQLSVPGDCYLIGREVDPGELELGTLLDGEPDEHGRVWSVQPVHTVRPSRRLIDVSLGLLTGGRRRRTGTRRGWQVQVDESRWVDLPGESLVCRVWNRNERLPWRAISPAKAALSIMREIDMYNRQIIASLVSRVALNGMLFIPDEVTFPVNPAYQNAGDPFVAELVDIMRAAIKNPGSPASAAPLPLRVPAEYIEKFRHLTFATPLDEKLFQYREQALRRLATTLNLPAEVLTGMGNTTHWAAWQLEESAIKLHISPKVETVVQCLTVGYLHPMLRSLGEPVRTSDGNRIVVWYDTSELTQRTDRSDVALKLRDMLVISDEATRREAGFDEADAPTTDELESMVLRKLAVQPQTAAPALKELTGLELSVPSPEAPTAGASSDAGGPVGAETSESSDAGDDAPSVGPPTTRYDQPPTDATTAATVPPPTPDERRRLVVRRIHGPLRRARESSRDGRLTRVGR